jgi:phosphoribosylformylglycinamidine cyclo-ligase
VSDSVSYKDAGVDIDAGNSFVEKIKPHVKSTMIPGVLGGIGSFAGAFELPTGYKTPVLLSGTDGVGTKLKLAIDSKRFDTVGIDLVAMCVNDIICNWGEPLFFLDYYATAKLEVDEASDVVKGIAEGCRQAECALVGGETAEMPGMYQEGDFDLAGFTVGIAEKDELDRLSRVRAGDTLIAVPSSGVHSNGYSLVRKLFFDKLDMKFEDEFDGKPLIETLMTPTRIYIKEFKKIRSEVNAIAHITGGGITENLPRVFPDNLRAEVKRDAIRTLPVFEFMSKYVEADEMLRTFNMGVGLVLCVDPANEKSVLEKLEDAYVIGKVIDGEKGVTFI